MQFKRHIMMTSAVASLAMGLSLTAGISAVHAQAAAQTSDGAVIVTGIRKSLQSSLKQKRSSDRAEEVITAEDVGKFPDKNVADSLSRATGVNVVTGTSAGGGFGENEHISIRGTDPNLNLTMLDGHNMATGDWFVLDQQGGGRAFNYTMLPSEVVGTVEVIKSSSADLPEGGIGGTVDVHVRNPLDLKPNMMSVSAQALYSTLPDKTTPQVSGMYSWRNDARTLGILVGAYYEKRDFRRDGQETLGYTGIANFNGTGKTVYMPSLIGSSFFQQERVRKGGNVHVQWKPSDTFELDFQGLYTHLDANNGNHNNMFWGSRFASQTPAAYTTTVNPADGNTYLTSGTWTLAQAQTADAGVVQDDIYRKAHSDSYDLNLDATWHATDKLLIKGQVGYTHGEGVTDDSVAWETYWNTGASFKQTGKATSVSYPDLPSDKTSAAYLNNKYSWSWGGTVSSPDKETYAKIDATYALDNGLFKDVQFGARYTDHARDLDFIAFSWGGNGDATLTKNLNVVFKGDATPADYANGIGALPGYTFANEQAIYDYENTHSGGRVFGFYAPASFAVKEKTQAFYGMTHLGGDTWKGNIGVRAVHTDSTSIQYTTNLPAAQKTNHSVFGDYGEVDTKRSYWDVLPSANFQTNLTSDLLFRFDVAKVLTRPGYAQLAGAYSLNDANYTGTAGGNPLLDPYRAWTWNSGLEWYYAPQALVAFSIYKIDFENFITTQTFHGTFTDVLNPGGHDFLMQGPANGGRAHINGYEANLQQPIGDTGFGFIANMTYADGKVEGGGPIDGNSKWTYNLTGYFENSLVSARLAYNYRSKFKSGTDRGVDMWQDSFGSLDGSFSYNVTQNIALTLDAQNIGHSKLYYFVGDPSIPRAYYDNGQTWYVGVRLKY